MTREEAIKHGKEQLEVFGGEHREFIGMAIKALEPCEDCVSRQAVLDMATTIQTDDYSGNEIMEVVDIEDVKGLPPVTPTRKIGKWIEGNYGNMISQHRWYCSECGGIHHDTETGEWREVFDFRYAYCPNCGAEMESEE